MTQIQDAGLYFMRKLAYVLYLEIGALQPEIHPELAAKADIKNAFFQRDKERQAADLYHQTLESNTTDEILAPFVERTGLTLEDIHRAFVEGDWRNKFGAYNFGGPKWIKIAAIALALKQAIDDTNWEKVEELLFEIKGLKTNHGYLINQFERTERRGK